MTAVQGMVLSHFLRQSFAVRWLPDFNHRYPRVPKYLHCLPWARRVNEGTNVLVVVDVVVVQIFDDIDPDDPSNISATWYGSWC